MNDKKKMLNKSKVLINWEIMEFFILFYFMFYKFLISSLEKHSCITLIC